MKKGQKNRQTGLSERGGKIKKEALTPGNDSRNTVQERLSDEDYYVVRKGIRWTVNQRKVYGSTCSHVRRSVK